MSAGRLYVGCSDPVSTVYVVSSTSVDLTTVASAVFHIWFEDDSEAEWAATLSAASPTSLTLTRVHAVGDVPEGAEGMGTIEPRLTIAGKEPLRCEPRRVQIAREGT